MNQIFLNKVRKSTKVLSRYKDTESKSFLASMVWQWFVNRG